MTCSILQHHVEIERNRMCLQRKPELRSVYARYYQMIRDRLVEGGSLELGSGIGQVREHIPDCLTSDLFAGSDIDRIENAYAVSLEDASLSNLVLLDVFHHLEYPGSALAEFRRVLRPGGRVILLDPAMGLVPRLVYGLFHHEPLGLGRPISWLLPPELAPSETGYFAAQARPWRIFMKREEADRIEGFRVLECTAWSDFVYLASGGFSKPTLYPSWLRPALARLDGFLSRLSPSLFAARMIVVLERVPA